MTSDGPMGFDKVHELVLLVALDNHGTDEGRAAMRHIRKGWTKFEGDMGQRRIVIRKEKNTDALVKHHPQTPLKKS